MRVVAASKEYLKIGLLDIPGREQSLFESFPFLCFVLKTLIRNIKQKNYSCFFFFFPYPISGIVTVGEEIALKYSYIKHQKKL